MVNHMEKAMENGNRDHVVKSSSGAGKEYYIFSDSKLNGLQDITWHLN